jgi:hypothetical protein
MGTMMIGQAAAMRDEYSNAKIQAKRKTKMSLKQRIRNWLKDDENEREELALPIISGPEKFDPDGMNIVIHTANGGYIAQFRRYDHRIDRTQSQLYIITSDQKFEEALAQCIAMECLSR